MSFDVIGMGNPLIDLLAQVPDEFLEQMHLEKDKMYLVDKERHEALLKALRGRNIVPEAAGSCANTMIGIAQLGGKAAYCGKVGADQYGQVYIEKLEAAGVSSFIQAGQEQLTGSTVILVTPDAARTMNTFLGACQHLTAADVPLDALKSSRMLYLTGYVWDTPDQQEAARLALETVQAGGVEVAMSLADPFCVQRHAEDFVSILKSHVDLVFANREEALAITGTDNAQQALRVLGEWCQTAVITMGGNGALIGANGETVYVDPFPVQALDSTGAGDGFAAGYLYGRISGASLLQCGRLGSYFASKVIERMGPRLDGDVPGLLAPVLGDPRP
ncbi:MAG: adenosine kinase [SAR324 cluster bacterium]|nr:adenosine kinase [SAR324 cluster bacterium]